MSIKTKRWNDETEPDDGYRLLVCRHRPRGVRKEDEPWDAWCTALAPSAELVARYYGKRGEPPSWETYRALYLEEMSARSFYLEGFAAQVARGEMLTLLCSSACTDATHCHRTVLAELLEARVAAILTPARTESPRWTRGRESPSRRRP